MLKHLFTPTEKEEESIRPETAWNQDMPEPKQKRKKILSEEEHVYKHLAKNSYIQGGRNRRAKLQEKDLGGWFEVKEFSNRNARVYENPFDGEVVVSYRGTDLKHHPWDLEPDIRIAASGFSHGPAPGQGMLGDMTRSERHVQAAQTAQDVRKAFPDAKLTLTGHSLGGNLAEYAGGTVEDSNVVIFNPFIMDMKSKGVGEKRETVIRNRGDWTSLITLNSKGRKVNSFGRYRDIIKGPLVQHALDNIDGEDEQTTF